MKKLLAILAIGCVCAAAAFIALPLLSPPAPQTAATETNTAPPEAPTTEPGAAPVLAPAQSNPAFVALIKDTPATQILAALQAYFPTEAATLEAKLAQTITADTDPAEAYAAVVVFSDQIRQMFAPNLAKAPDAALQDVLTAKAEIIAGFSDQPQVCNRAIVSGPFALTLLEAEGIPGIGTSADVLFQALHQGQRADDVRRNPNGQDLAQLTQAFAQSGGSEADLNLVFNPDPEDPRLCGAMLRFLQVLSTADFEGAVVLRAAITVAMIGT